MIIKETSAGFVKDGNKSDLKSKRDVVIVFLEAQSTYI